jgi:hypothetical protein
MKTFYQINFNMDRIQNNGKADPVANKGTIELSLRKNEYFMGFSNSWELGKTDIENLNIPDIKPGKTFSIKDKTVYRFPNLSLPRQKVDLLKEKENIKVVRDPDKADIHVISYKFLRNLFDFRWENNAVSFVDFFNIIKLGVEEGLFSQECTDYLKLMIKDADKDSYVALKKNYYYSSSPHIKQWDDKFTDIVNKYKKDYTKVIVIEEKNKKVYENFLSSNAEIVYDTDILDIIDSELAVLEDDQYDNIMAMITSSDRDNRTLGVEMLANCNIEKSFNIVSDLYWWHYDFIKDTNNWNSVNVKSLRNRMKSYEGGHNTSNIYSFNAYLNQLAKDGKLTRFAVDKTREKLYKTLISSICGDKSQVFKVDLENLYIADELENMINE